MSRITRLFLKYLCQQSTFISRMFWLQISLRIPSEIWTRFWVIYKLITLRYDDCIPLLALRPNWQRVCFPALYFPRALTQFFAERLFCQLTTWISCGLLDDTINPAKSKKIKNFSTCGIRILHHQNDFSEKLRIYNYCVFEPLTSPISMPLDLNQS